METRLTKFIESQLFYVGNEICFEKEEQIFATYRDTVNNLPLRYERTFSNNVHNNELKIEATLIQARFVTEDICYATYCFKVIANTPID